MVLWIFVIYDTRIFCYVIHLILLWANEPIQGLACHIEATVFQNRGVTFHSSSVKALESCFTYQVSIHLNLDSIPFHATRTVSCRFYIELLQYLIYVRLAQPY